MATPYAFVTLVSSDFYLPGALALAAALKDLHPFPPTQPEVEFQTVCLVTPETVDVSTIKLLRSAYDVVVGVEIVEQEDDRKLRLLGRPDLNTVLTKLHIFRLTQYSKIIFLDADVLPVLPISHLFTAPHEFAAVPDVGWPDIFNSGVLVVSPGEDKFQELMELQKTKGSWDGGDQGLLNEWRGSNWYRLSFVYNTTPTAAYTYAPAYERFGSAIRAIHFIGYDKPWRGLTYRSPGIKSSEAILDDGTKRAYNYEALVDKWYEVYDTHYRMEPVSTSPDFKFDTFISAWDAGVPAEIRPQSSSGVTLSLEDLRRVAVEGLGSLRTVSAPPAAGPVMGEYRSLPLEGRVDLMRPRKPEPEPEPEPGPSTESGQQEEESPGTPRPTHIQIPPDQVGYFRMDTLPTPAPSEVPPAPYHYGRSLPPTQTPTPYYGPPSQYRDPHAEQNSLQVSYQPQAHSESGSAYVGSHSHGGSQHSMHPSQPHLPPQTPHHHHRGSSFSAQQRVSFTPQESSDSEQTSPGTQYPSHQPHHRQHTQTHISPPGYSSPKRGDQRRGGYETPRNQQGQQERHSYGGDHTPTQDQPWRHEGHRGQQQQGQAQHHSHHHQHSHGHPQHHEQHHGHVHHEQHGQPQHYQPTPPPRPISPPKVEWNPAVEPPPKTPPPPSAFPEDTYYPNIWDQPAGQRHDTHHRSVASPAPAERAFFDPPPPSTIPDQLIREGQYSNVLGPAPPQDSPESVSSPAPDKSKVHTVFPWEEKPRHFPRRVFPRTDTPPPGANYIESERTSSPISTPPPPPEHSSPQIQPATSPLSSPWGGSGFSNAWDAVPSIQRYAQKLAGSPKIFPYQYMTPPPPPRDDDWKKQWEKQREKEMRDRHDASSMDGDDEDEDDEEFDEEELEASEGSSRGKRSQNSRRKPHGQNQPRSKKKYRSRGVQAKPDTAEQGIQATIPSERPSRDIGTETAPLRAPAPAPAPAGVGLGIRRQWADAPTLLPSAVPRDFTLHQEQGAGTPIVPTAGRSSDPFPSLATPSGLRSPATLGSPRTYSPPKVASPLRAPSSPKVTSPPAVSSPLREQPSPVKALAQPAPTRLSILPQATSRPAPVRKLSTSPPTGSGSSRPSSPVVGAASRGVHFTSTPSPKHTRLSSISPELSRSISTESAVTPSPTTTHDSPITPADATPRKGSRVWDPARGVDVFKRGSEEVLARFLRMGSFGEENKQRQAV